MCGISLIVNGSREEVQIMGEAIQHRGTRHNIFELGDLKVWFSCLPITDQSAPMQPYEHHGKYFWLNGFISNYKELAVKHNIQLTTNCDTELLSKFKGDYLELNGFFSIVIYDAHSKELNCFTDRYGCKQLYEYRHGEKIYISSEVKAIKAVRRLNQDHIAVEDWLYSLGVMTDNTIYSGVERIESLPFVKPKQVSISYDKAKEKLNFLLDQSIKRNKVKGLKDGVFLSGGIDSGLLAKRLQPDYCFSMDYVDQSFSEIENIKLNSVGTHITMLCNEYLFNRYKEKTFKALDDLKAGSCYTNLALTETASKFCTVLYSGAGGDELFHGYTHRYGMYIQDVIKRTEYPGKIYPDATHSGYDWRFLRAVLVVEDRMSGFHTMETRYPFLDNDLVDFVLSLPTDYTFNKRILRDVCGLDERVINGRKRGFSNPYISNYDWAKLALRSV
jgi:asparagine synthase (glutamine-hydrolysing)